MKTFWFLAFLVLAVLPAPGANPPYTAFKGYNGVTVSTNPSTGEIKYEIMGAGFRMTNPAPTLYLEAFGNSGTNLAAINFTRVRDTMAVPADTVAGDILSRIDTWGNSGGIARGSVIETKANADFIIGTPSVMSFLLGRANSIVVQQRTMSLTAYGITNNATAYFLSNALFSGSAQLVSSSGKALVLLPGTSMSSNIVLTFPTGLSNGYLRVTSVSDSNFSVTADTPAGLTATTQMIAAAIGSLTLTNNVDLAASNTVNLGSRLKPSGTNYMMAFQMPPNARKNRTLKSDDDGFGSWSPNPAGGNGNEAGAAAPSPGAVQYAATNGVDGMMLESTNTFLYRQAANELAVTNTANGSNTTIGAGYINTTVFNVSNLNASVVTVSNGLPAPGSDKMLLFNSNGVVSAESGFTYDYSENLFTAPSISTYAVDATQVTYPMGTITVVGANSNQTVWATTTNVVDMFLSTNVTFTNFSTATAKSGTYLAFMKVTNSAGNIGVNWGLGAGYGKYVFTNANNAIWPTLTNTKTYVASWTFRGTNIHLRLSLEE